MKQRNTYIENSDLDEAYSVVLGLSCVENHILSSLYLDGFPIELLYFNSFIEIDALWEAFFLKKNDYAHFDGIIRIQDTAKKYGLISMKLYKKDLDQFIHNMMNSDHFFLMLLKPKVSQDQFQVRGWHEKHYAKVILDENQCHIINDIPFKEKTIFLYELNDYYSGEFLDYVLNKKRYKEIEKLLNSYSFKIAASSVKHKFISSDDFVAFRDMIGVYRILIRRQKYYCGLKMNTNFFDTLIKEIDSIYMRVEYMYLKNTCDIKNINFLWNSVIEIDKEIREKIIKEQGLK